MYLSKEELFTGDRANNKRKGKTEDRVPKVIRQDQKIHIEGNGHLL